MAEVALFHHAQGLTPGVAAFADGLRRAGHNVHAPDLYDGRTFATLEEGVAHAEEIGFGVVTERGLRAVEGLPAGLVYAGFSLGVLPAQRLAQTRLGARGALLFHACLPVSELGPSWPAGVPTLTPPPDRVSRAANLYGRTARAVVRRTMPPAGTSPRAVIERVTAPPVPTVSPPRSLHRQSSAAFALVVEVLRYRS